MRVNKAVPLALLSIFAISALVTAYLWQNEREAAKTEFIQKERQKIATLEKIIDLKSQSYKRFVSDYSLWDEMVDFSKSKDKKWAYYNIDISLEGFGINAACVVDDDGKCAYSASQDIEPFDLCKNIDVGLLDFYKPVFYKFFAKNQKGVVEIHGAPIQNSDDANRSGKPSGYIFAAKLWDESYIKELESFAQSDIALENEIESCCPSPYELSSHIPLKGQYKDTVTYLHISGENTISKTLDDYAAKNLIHTVAVAVASLVLLLFLTAKHISKPLSDISQALIQRDPDKIKRYALKNNEYAQISSLITEFFDAQKKLQEINETLLEPVEAEVVKNREQERSLYQKSKSAAMGDMLNNIAHQWRQPLNTINILVGKIEFGRQRGALTNEMLDDSVKKIQLITAQMSNTIEDFKNFFKPNKAKSEFSLLECIENSVSIVRESYETNNINIIVNCDRKLTIFGYKGELAQAFLVFFENSKDAIIEKNGPKGGDIRVIAKEDGSKIIIDASDNGGGVKEEILPRIFEPFFTTKAENKGSGVGLYMAKQIIEFSMGGKISAFNDKGGLKITVELKGVKRDDILF